MTLNSSEFNSCIIKLREIDFELAYLALLTYRGVKPLSRWEKPLENKALEYLQKMGLIVKQVNRSVKTGDEVTETIFSLLPAYIRFYELNFADKPIDKSTQTQRLEGFLFGYPSCCIEQYIKRPYTANDLSEQQQKILFYWTCSNCRITPLLVSSYENIYSFVKQL